MEAEVNELLLPKEASEVLGVSRGAFNRLAATGTLKPARTLPGGRRFFSRKYLIRVKVLQEYLAREHGKYYAGRPAGYWEEAAACAEAIETQGILT